MRALACLLFLAFLAPAAEAAGEITVSAHRIYTGRDDASGPINFRIAIVEPANPRAIAILFAGGRGVVFVNLDGSIAVDGNFLVRSRQFFAENGVTAVVMDAPRDRQNLIHTDGAPVGLGLGFRLTETHAGDIQRAIDFMRARNPRVPVWLVGTSRGSTSVAYATMHLKRLGRRFGPDGIALTSAIVVPVPPAVEPTDRDSLLNPDFGLRLAEIRVPTLVVHHIDDACNITPYSGVRPLLRALRRVDELELFSIRGGGPPTGLECEAFHYHGFVGIEEKVVTKMSRWIREASNDLRHRGRHRDGDNDDHDDGDNDDGETDD